MKVLLVQPHPRPDFRQTRSVGRRPLTPPLNLPYIAALTPPDIEVAIVDEAVAEVDLDAGADLVGISALTMAAPRAYELAEAFRRRGTSVVLGGVHATVLPDEAQQHVDAVVVGEAEDVWPQLLTDFQSGALAPRYERCKPHDLRNLPVPRWDLVRPASYFTANVVQSTRGCPYRCQFCSIWRTAGGKHRCRPVEEVIREAAALDGRLLGFADADIASRPSYARKLFEALAPLGKRWVSDAGIGIARHPDLLQWAARSGCRILYIGFESLSQQGLKSAGKVQNLAVACREAIDRIHDAGILVGAGFIFGLDDDGPDVFERTVDFAISSKVDMADFHVLCPYPGTAVYDQLLSEGRILHRDWSRYSKYNVVYRPRQLSPEQLQAGCAWSWQEFYSAGSILRRLPARHLLKSWLNPVAFSLLNATLNREAARHG